MSWRVVTREGDLQVVARFLVVVLLAAAVVSVGLALGGCQIEGPAVEGQRFVLKYTTSPPVPAPSAPSTPVLSPPQLLPSRGGESSAEPKGS